MSAKADSEGQSILNERKGRHDNLELSIATEQEMMRLSFYTGVGQRANEVWIRFSLCLMLHVWKPHLEGDQGEAGTSGRNEGR
jgi:hypothetical protein